MKSLLATPVRRLAVLAVGLSLAIPIPLQAAVKTWDGSSSGLWGVAANWAGGVVPANGDDVIFPSGAANVVNTNNLALRLRSITFTGSGYTVRGNALGVTNGISGQQASGTNTVELNASLGADQTLDCTTAGARQILSGNITNAGYALTLGGAGNLTAAGIIAGAGGLTKSGSGTASLTGLRATATPGRRWSVAACWSWARRGGKPLWREVRSPSTTRRCGRRWGSRSARFR